MCKETSKRKLRNRKEPVEQVYKKRNRCVKKKQVCKKEESRTSPTGTGLFPPSTVHAGKHAHTHTRTHTHTHTQHTHTQTHIHTHILRWWRWRALLWKCGRASLAFYQSWTCWLALLTLLPTHLTLTRAHRCVCVRACLRACVLACVRACVRVCVRVCMH